MRSIVAMNPSGRVTLPRDARRALGLEGEGLFEVEVRPDAIILHPVTVVPLEQVRHPQRKRQSA